MSVYPTSIDISNYPELLRVAEEVSITKKPLVLTRNDNKLAVIMPVGTITASKKKRKKSKTDYEAFRSAAGGWKDVDTDRLLKDIYADRQKTNARGSIVL